MNICEFEKYFIEYVSGQLDNTEKFRFQMHLEECNTCPQNLDEFYLIHQVIHQRKRPEPQESILTAYHESLQQIFTDHSKKNRVSTLLSKVFNLIIPPKSPRFRLAEVSAFILVGLILGWLIFTPANKQVIVESMDPELFAKPVLKSELDYLNYYFQAAELLLLEIKNTDPNATMNYDDFEFNKEIAQKLLIKTFIIHEIALKQNDPNILRFLSKMEILLYEISNISDEDLPGSLMFFNRIIDDAYLLDEARKFQNRLIRFKTPIQKPK